MRAITVTLKGDHGEGHVETIICPSDIVSIDIALLREDSEPEKPRQKERIADKGLVKSAMKEINKALADIGLKAVEAVAMTTKWHYTTYIAGSCNPRYDIKSRDGTRIGTVRIEADAQLMAAAPDLLEAAEAALEELCEDDRISLTWDDTILALRQAIAKGAGNG